MLSNEARQRLRQELERFGAQILRLSPNHREEARSFFKQLDLGGPIRAVTPVEHRSERLLELAARRFPEYAVLYALDGGSTRPKRLENGTVLCAFQAVLTGDPHEEMRHRGLPLEAFRSLSLVTHAQRADLGGADAERFGDEYVHLWRIHISRTYLEQEVERVASGLARMAAEPYHALRMTDELDIGDGVFIVDGSLYPIGLYYYIARSETDASWQGDITWTSWGPALGILAQPLKVVETCSKRGIALVGLNKNPGTSWLLEFALDWNSHNWSSDAQFIRAVLSETPADSLGYTNWFVQEGYSVPRQRGREPESFDIFERLEAFDLDLPAPAYHVCFFYIYDPRVQAVLKAEVPRTILDAHDPERLRLKILAEIARGKGVPQALRRADSRARITQEEGLNLMEACSVGLDTSYNQSRGEPL